MPRKIQESLAIVAMVTYLFVSGVLARSGPLDDVDTMDLGARFKEFLISAEGTGHSVLQVCTTRL